MDTKRNELTEAAEAYDSLFVPALFGQWAEKLSKTMSLSNGMSVLDVACGTGALTAEIQKRIDPDGKTTGLDIHSGMLQVAKSKNPEINWQQGDSSELPFPENTFDAVGSQFGLMFFPSPAKSVSEMLRVLKPGGALSIAVWDEIENIDGYSTELAMIESAAGTDAGNAVRVPFSLGSKSKLEKIFKDGGASDIHITTNEGIAKFPSIRAMVEAELRGWLPIMGVELESERIERILETAEVTMARYRKKSGDIEFPVTAHFIQASG